MKFRNDINGLRTLAVLAVVLFHFGLHPFGGGFVGVDIFFVISGYLMTAMILPRFLQDRFELSEFYFARARRIVPALAFLCIALALVGWFYLPPSLYGVLGKHIAASLAFLSNIVYWREAGYFDTASHYKWLLHTWSLSVEWQFYLLYPLSILAVGKWFRSERSLQTALWIMFVGSLLLCIAATAWKPSAAFYLLPTRTWELIAGGLVFMHGQRGVSQRTALVLQTLGFGLMVFSIIALSEARWPGYLATLPVAGASLFILANRQSSYLLNNAFVQAIGRWSYSIYLWHWPMVVALHYAHLEKSSLWRAAGIFGSVVAGALSYTFVERRTTALLSRFPKAGSTLVLALPVCFVLIAGSAIWLMQGIRGRVSAEVNIADAEAQNNNQRRDACLSDGSQGLALPGCVFGNEKFVRAVVWGDSHADAVINAVAAAAGEDKGVLFFGYQSCLSVPGAITPAPNCARFNDRVLAALNQIDTRIPLIIVDRWSSYDSIVTFRSPAQPSGGGGGLQATPRICLRTMWRVITHDWSNRFAVFRSNGRSMWLSLSLKCR